MSEEKRLWNFPCPHCGSEERVAQTVVDADKVAGKLSDKVVLGVSQIQKLEVKEPKRSYRPGDKASVLLCYHDYCAKCGTNYCFLIKWEEVKFSMNLDNLIKIPPPGFPSRGVPGRN